MCIYNALTIDTNTVGYLNIAFALSWLLYVLLCIWFKVLNVYPLACFYLDFGFNCILFVYKSHFDWHLSIWLAVSFSFADLLWHLFLRSLIYLYFAHFTCINSCRSSNYDLAFPAAYPVHQSHAVRLDEG